MIVITEQKWTLKEDIRPELTKLKLSERHVSHKHRTVVHVMIFMCILSVKGYTWEDLGGKFATTNVKKQNGLFVAAESQKQTQYAEGNESIPLHPICGQLGLSEWEEMQ